MENQDAGVAEAGRRKGLKIPCESLETPDVSGNIEAVGPTETPPNPPGLETSPQYQQFLKDGNAAIERAIAQAEQDQALIDQRLCSALVAAGQSALGLPGTVDTFKEMLADAGLALVLAPKGAF